MIILHTRLAELLILKIYALLFQIYLLIMYNAIELQDFVLSCKRMIYFLFFFKHILFKKILYMTYTYKYNDKFKGFENKVSLILIRLPVIKIKGKKCK